MVKIIQFSPNGQAQAIFMQALNNARAARRKSRRGPGQHLGRHRGSPGGGTFLQSQPLRSSALLGSGAVVDRDAALRRERRWPRKRRAVTQTLQMLRALMTRPARRQLRAGTAGGDAEVLAGVPAVCSRCASGAQATRSYSCENQAAAPQWGSKRVEEPSALNLQRW